MPKTNMGNMKQKNQSESSHAVHSISSTRRGLLFSFLLTGGFFVIELIVGLRINSVAVVADAGHNFSAAAGVGIALLATIFASKPPTSKRTFGFLKIEMLSAWINGILLLAMAYLILKMGIQNLLNPQTIDTLPMIMLAVVGLIIGGIPAMILYNKQKTDINVRGAFWHVMETVFGSAAVLIAAILVRFTGWLQADAIFGMLLVPVLIIAAWGIMKASTRTLLDLTPKDLDLMKIKESIQNLDGVKGTHHIHAWTVGVGKNIFSAHVHIKDSSKNEKIQKEIHRLLRTKFKIYFSTVQIEENCMDEEIAKEIEIA